MDPLNILHVFRAPIGGLFRHVLDLAQGQIARDHRVGLIADSSTGGARADDMLQKLEPFLALGLTRFPMPRQSRSSRILIAASWLRAKVSTCAPMWRTEPALRLLSRRSN